MKTYRHSKASLFLMEIMLNILFFSILVTICLQMFIKAHNLSDSTTVLHRAVSTCTSIAEVYQSSNEGKESILHIYPEATEQGNIITIYFDDKFVSCSKEESCYYASITLNSDSLSTAEISFSEFENEEELYSLSVSGYHPQTLSSIIGGDTHE